MNNIIHRNQAQGASITSRKRIEVDKSPLLTGGNGSSMNKEEPVTAGNPAGISPPETPIAETKEETQPEQTRAQKKQEYSTLEKARRLEAEAKDKLRKAQQLSEAYQSNDLDQIAKANGMSTTDYVRWVNAKAIGAPTTKALTPAEQVAQNAKNWQEKQEQDIQQIKQTQSNLNKDWYINKNILPHLIKNPDKYELISDKGVDDVCSIIYDFMNEEFVATQQELDPVALLDAYEEDLLEEWKQTQQKAAKFKKLNAQPNDPNRPAKIIPRNTSTDPLPQTDDDMLAQTLASEDTLAQGAPSNLVAGPSRGAPDADTPPRKPSFKTGGTTPKDSRFSREARLAEMAKGR